MELIGEKALANLNARVERCRVPLTL